MTRATVKAVPQQCNATEHFFVNVETTQPAVPYQQMQGLSQYGIGGPVRTFKLFCNKCGQIRAL